MSQLTNKSDNLEQLLNDYKNDKISLDEILLVLKQKPFVDLGFAKVDLHRKLRQGVTEVIYGAGKTPLQIESIAQSMIQSGQNCIMITRLIAENAQILKKSSLASLVKFTYFEQAHIGLFGSMPSPSGNGYIAIVCAGTSDLSVAEEAAYTAEILGNDIKKIYDVGVAGIHRLLSYSSQIMKAQVVIAVAGMEGALASVVGGLTSAPVIAVPTSVGYGASFHGVSALLSMLNSCSSGVSVVNIDNGFGAAFQAHLINHLSLQ